MHVHELKMNTGSYFDFEARSPVYCMLGCLGLLDV